MEEVRAYIESGILELYVLGQLSAQECNEVEAMAAKHPEVKAEITAIELAMEAYAFENAINPSSNVEAKILAEIGSKPVEKEPKIAVYSPKSKLPWDDAVTLVLTYAEIPYELIYDDDVLKDKLIKRNVSLKHLDASEPALSGKTYRISCDFKEGISTENAKKIAKMIRDEGPKSVKTQIQGDELRVTSKSRDDLQETMAMIKDGGWDFAVQFTNFR